MPKGIGATGIKQKTIEKIVDATIKLLMRKGYEETSTTEIANSANVSVGLIYKYFPEGKEDIIQYLTTSGYVDFIEEIETEWNPKKSLDITISQILRKFVTKHQENAELLRGIEIAYLTKRELFTKTSDVFTKENQWVVLMLDILQHYGIHDQSIQENQLRRLLSMIDGIVHRYVLFPSIFSSDNELIAFLQSIIYKYLNLADS